MDSKGRSKIEAVKEEIGRTLNTENGIQLPNLGRVTSEFGLRDKMHTLLNSQLSILAEKWVDKSESFDQLLENLEVMIGLRTQWDGFDKSRTDQDLNPLGLEIPFVMDELVRAKNLVLQYQGKTELVGLSDQEIQQLPDIFGLREKVRVLDPKNRYIN